MHEGMGSTGALMACKRWPGRHVCDHLWSRLIWADPRQLEPCPEFGAGVRKFHEIVPPIKLLAGGLSPRVQGPQRGLVQCRMPRTELMFGRKIFCVECLSHYTRLPHTCTL